MLVIEGVNEWLVVFIDFKGVLLVKFVVYNCKNCFMGGMEGV